MRVLISGVTGQDGSYLAEQLAAGGHEVFGLLRGQHNPKRAWLEKLVPSVRLIEGDLLDQSSLQSALKTADPEVVYNLGALTYVGMSWEQPALMTEVTGLGCLRMLEAIRMVDSGIRFVQASSSEQFGSSAPPQSEHTQFKPRSPYGVAKTFAHLTTVNYRESYGLHASTAIMFNHESPRRGTEFVTRKVTSTVAAILGGRQDSLALGNLTARRDWGWAPEYMTALPLIAGQATPGDYVLATGEDHSVYDLCREAFAVVGLDWEKHVIYDARLERPADVEVLRGWPHEVSDKLGWSAQVKFPEIIRRMVEHDLDVG